MALQQLTDELDAGNAVLTESTDVADVRTLDGIQRRINELKIEMLPAGVERLRDPDAELSPPESLADYVSVKKRRSPALAGKVLAKTLAGRVDGLVPPAGTRSPESSSVRRN